MESKTIKLIDCTLRDGGYINNWEFGKDAIYDMTRKLEQTNIEILELGFIKDEPYSEDRTVFNNIAQVKKIMGEKKPGIEYAVMAEVINPLPLEKLEPASPDGPDIIRVIVWKRMLQEGFEYCKGIVEKGYKLCVQPARVNQYSDEEFVEMIELFNQLNPLAIYVVDSWGTMYKDELLHYLELADKHLKPEIAVGYHGHNNMMQAYDVACAFVEKNLNRDLIIDASIYGIGRGAGNLNTELFTKYMNEKFNYSYNLNPITEIYDFYISKIYEKYKWGYSVPYLITAKYNCNPDFADYYDKKGCSPVLIEECISSMTPDERIIFKIETAEKYLKKKDFDKWNKKLAVLLITANKPDVVESNLLGCAYKLNQKGIDLIVYDSSDDEYTKEVVDKYSSLYPSIKYDRWNGVYDGVSIDDKVISAYKKYASEYEYLWTIRDGLIVLTEDIDNELNRLMGAKKELIVVDHFMRDVNKYGSKEYTDCISLFKEQCVHMNTLGAYILKSDFVQKVIDEIPLNEKTYGLYFPMALFHYYAKNKVNAASYVGIPWCFNFGSTSASFWTKKLLWQWGAQWVDMIDNLPSLYAEYKKVAYKVKTADFEPFSLPYIMRAREYGGLTLSLINKYKKYLPKVCSIPLWQIYTIACIPISLVSSLENIITKFKSKREYVPFYKNSNGEKKGIINYEENKNCFELTKDVRSHLLYENNKVEKPFISVFIPTYKRPDFLAEAIESVMNQQPVDFDWDIIVVDNEPYNNNPNQTEKVVRSFESDRISYYRNSENLRVGDNFNRGIELAKAPWVMMLHDDDLLLPSAVKKMGNTIEFLQSQKGKPLGVISARPMGFEYDPNFPFAHKDDLSVSLSLYGSKQISYKYNELTHSNVAMTGHVGGDVPSIGTTFNKKAVLDVGGFNDDFGISADLILYYNLETKYSAYATTEPYGFYRYGENAMSKPESIYKLIKDNFDFREYILSKNVFAKIYGYIFRSILYYKFTSDTLKTYNKILEKDIQFSDCAFIYNKKPNKIVYTIWKKLVLNLYNNYKNIRKSILKKRAKKIFKSMEK